MHNLIEIPRNKQLNIIVPASILSHKKLSLNQKLILGLDYSFSLKLGHNSMTNKDVGGLLSLHPNIIGYCRRHLVKEGFLVKSKACYILTEKHKQFTTFDTRSILLPNQLYNHNSLTAGAKLLWGEYNSISKGKREYFAKRSYSAKRLSVSEESVTNWTKQLFDKNFLIQYSHKKGYCKSQKVIITTSFS